ncbi:hypothetical protein [Legionella sainthelensi]|uniref:hypothetical protein n=1 Tax=Legionella sainthelensi TaxID=28087 RepID=UPI00286CF6C6|nr:hypothetical protein [Legionella sainthelensi]
MRDKIIDDELEADALDGFVLDDPVPHREVDKTNFVYRPETNWEVNNGMNSSRLHKLYSLFFDKKSAFNLGEDVIVSGKSPLEDAYSLQAKNSDQQIFLFRPDGGNIAYYDADSKSEAGWLDGQLAKSLAEITAFCATTSKPTTFVIPCVEMPTNLSKGVQHQILLTFNYDPIKKQLTPTVYDSIGRDTYAESFSSYFKSKSRSTCDDILNQSIKKAAKEVDSSLTVSDLNRIAYNHQNRLTEGNCGSYTFRTIKEVVSSAAQGIAVKIPGSGYITSDSYLTAPHVQQIQECIKYRTLGFTEIERTMNEGSASPTDLSEFISALEVYGQLRAQQPEKGMLNLVGYSKLSKLAAVELLTGILKDINDGKEISESQYIKLKEQTACLMDSSLGSLVQFHLKNLGAESLEKLVMPHMKLDFVLIEEELFDVPEITGTDLAANRQAPVSEDALQRQRQMREGVADIRRENEADTDLTERVVVTTRV